MKHRPGCWHRNCTSSCIDSRTCCATVTAVDRYAHINDNDVIRVERVGTPTAWEGRASRIYDNEILAVAGICINGQWTDEEAAIYNVTVLHRNAGDEPAPVSVVLDAEDRAWQRAAGSPDGYASWYSIGSDYPRGWQELNDLFGPIQSTYQPSQAAS